MTDRYTEQLTRYLEIYDSCATVSKYQDLWEISEAMIDEFLRKRWPELMANDQLEISILPGWIPVIDRLCRSITEVLNENPGVRVTVHQVKEKFGGLRFYATVDSATMDECQLCDEHIPASTRIYELIKRAEREADFICETCGAPGKKVTRGWIKTACDKHA